MQFGRSIQVRCRDRHRPAVVGKVFGDECTRQMCIVIDEKDVAADFRWLVKHVPDGENILLLHAGHCVDLRQVRGIAAPARHRAGRHDDGVEIATDQFGGGDIMA